MGAGKDKKVVDRAKQLSPARRASFWFFALLIPLFLLVAAEYLIRLASDDKATNALFVPAEENPQFLRTNPAFFRRYFGEQFEPTFANTPFRAHKKANAFRVVVLGGSTTVGYPYNDYLSFPSLLEQRLVERLPDSHVEVINLGATACNSYTLLDIVEDIVDLEPDAVLIYAGHNEYYGALGAGNSMMKIVNRGWAKRLVLKLKDFALYRLLESLLAVDPQGEEGATMMERAVGDASIAFRGEVFEQGIRQYAANMERLLKRLREARVPVFLATLASNLKDQPPLGDDMSARESFEEGKKLWLDQDTTVAAEKFLMAKDLDPVRFRAPSAINNVIRQLEVDAVVDIETLAAERSKSTIPDDSFFADHLHPNHLGYRLMGDAFFMALEKHFSETWPQAGVTSSTGALMPGISRLDLKLAELQIFGLKLGFPFKKNTTPGAQLRLLNLKLDSLRYSAYEMDQLGFGVMSGRVEVPEAMRQAFLMSLGRRDTVQALLHLEAMVKMSPFDIEQLNQAENVADVLAESPQYGNLARRLSGIVANMKRGQN